MFIRRLKKLAERLYPRFPFVNCKTQVYVKQDIYINKYLYNRLLYLLRGRRCYPDEKMTPGSTFKLYTMGHYNLHNVLVLSYALHIKSLT